MSDEATPYTAEEARERADLLSDQVAHYREVGGLETSAYPIERDAATLRAYADMIDRKRAVYASALEAWEARKAAFGQWGLSGTVTQRAFDEGYIAARDRQGERIERLRAALNWIALNMERAYGTVGLDRKELLAKMGDAGRQAYDALKEDDSHVRTPAPDPH